MKVTLVLTALLLSITSAFTLEPFRFYDHLATSQDTVRIQNKVFGSIENPIVDGNYGIIVTDTPTHITGCTFYLDGGHGIGVWGVYDDVYYCVIKNNNFVVLDSLNRYVIRVGHDSSDEPYTVYNPIITGNVLDCIEADTYKHNLFVGHCINPVVQWNRVMGSSRSLMPRGEIGNAPDFDSGISWFEPRRGILN